MSASPSTPRGLAAPLAQQRRFNIFRPHIVTGFLLGLLGLFWAPASAWADTLTGTVVSIDTVGSKLVVLDKVKKTNRNFSLLRGGQVTIDGKKAQASEVEVGATITVIYTGNVATRLIVKKDADAGDKPANKPATPAATTPAPTRPTPAASPATPNRPAATVRTPSKSDDSASAGDWPQYNGPRRDNISTETGLLKSWPDDGPPRAWTASGLGEGYSAVSVSDGRVFTMGNIGDEEHVIALDLQSGQKLWSTRSGRAFRENMGNGPRSTPTVDGDRVYALGANGDLVCLEASSGTRRWHVNILDAFGGNNIQWGISESVLVDGDRVICTPGGREATFAGLNKMTGKLVWRSQVPRGGNASYSSITPIVVDGMKQYVNFTSSGVMGIRATDGQPLWGHTESSNTTANCSSPVYENGMLFSASGYGTGGAMFRLSARGQQASSSVGYTTRNMKSHHGGMAIVNGCIYGTDEGIMTCLDLKTGDVKWQNRSVGKGAITVADGHIYLRSEGGPVALIEVNPDSYVQKGRFDQPQRSDRPSWPHPVIARGMLFLRDMDRLLVYRVRAD